MIQKAQIIYFSFWHNKRCISGEEAMRQIPYRIEILVRSDSKR
jgi:hypothetical protein